MSTSLRNRLSDLASAFAGAIVAAICRASLEDLLEVSPAAASGAKALAKKVKRPVESTRKGADSRESKPRRPRKASKPTVVANQGPREDASAGGVGDNAANPSEKNEAQSLLVGPAAAEGADPEAGSNYVGEATPRADDS